MTAESVLGGLASIVVSLVFMGICAVVWLGRWRADPESPLGRIYLLAPTGVAGVLIGVMVTVTPWLDRVYADSEPGPLDMTLSVLALLLLGVLGFGGAVLFAFTPKGRLLPDWQRRVLIQRGVLPADNHTAAFVPGCWHVLAVGADGRERALPQAHPDRDAARLVARQAVTEGAQYAVVRYVRTPREVIDVEVVDADGR